jgi:uncharacterized membrane protein HdeD (DUF308 family)
MGWQICFLKVNCFYKENKLMSKGSSGIHLSGTVVGILAIVAGVLVVFNAFSLQWVVGIFLIVFGIMSLTGK